MEDIYPSDLKASLQDTAHLPVSGEFGLGAYWLNGEQTLHTDNPF